MPVIDVDCHFDLPGDPTAGPLREFVDQLPDVTTFVVSALMGDLLKETPLDDVPDPASLAVMLPDANLSAAEQAIQPGVMPARYPSADPETRVAWMDRVGIDHALMNPGAPGMVIDLLTKDRVQAVRCYNDYVAEHLRGHTGRVSPVCLTAWTDLDSTIAELRHMRDRGSRAFWIKAEPLDGLSLGHPGLDPLWATATDLGMIAILHVGNAPVRFGGGWANLGWTEPGGAGLGGFYRLAQALRHHPAEMALATMLYGGVFGRHPELTVLTEELSLGWIPYFVQRCESLGPAGPWPFELSPAEMIRRGLRVTPLPGLGDTGITEAIEALPELLVFSSDYPHGEGNQDPLRLYDSVLEPLAEPLRQRFLGGNILECFTRMGDPLSLA